MLGSNVFFNPQPRYIQFTAMKEERNEKMFKQKKLESDKFDRFLLQKCTQTDRLSKHFKELINKLLLLYLTCDMRWGIQQTSFCSH